MNDEEIIQKLCPFKFTKKEAINIHTKTESETKTKIESNGTNYKILNSTLNTPNTPSESPSKTPNNNIKKYEESDIKPHANNYSENDDFINENDIIINNNKNKICNNPIATHFSANVYIKKCLGKLQIRTTWC